MNITIWRSKITILPRKFTILCEGLCLAPNQIVVIFLVVFWFLILNITITNGEAWSIEFWTNGGYFDMRKKSLETRSEAECF